MKLLRKACRYWGVQPDYFDASGKWVKAEDTSLLEILENLANEKIADDADLKRLIFLAREKKCVRILEPVYAGPAHVALPIAVHFPEVLSSDDLQIEIQLETEGLLKPTFSLEIHPPRKCLKQFGRRFFRIILKEGLPMGYHKLKLLDGGNILAESRLIIGPTLTPKAQSKDWGLFVPLFGVRNERNWGCGDLTDVSELQKIIFAHGGSFLGSLPLLASDLEGEIDPSPYSPHSKLFWNELYLDVEELARDCPEAMATIEQPALRARVRKLQDAEKVNYQQVAELKRPVLKLLAQHFFRELLPNNLNLKTAYGHFLKELPLVQAYADFRSAGEPTEKEYHLYVQFQMHQKLIHLCKAAHHGKTGGLYLDFPVGVRRGGFDEHYFSKSFHCEFSTGAPPDLMFLEGQNWGFPPACSQGLRETGYEYLSYSLRQHLRHATVLRIDHAMSFHRIYVIPKGKNARQGTYLRFNSQEFFAVLGIEMMRSKALIVGEDLGTVPDEMRHQLLENGCYGMWVFPFEAGRRPASAIQHAPVKKLACLNTHDMVPFAGYCSGRDLDFFKELNIISQQEFLRQSEERQQLVAQWMDQENSSNYSNLYQRFVELMAQSPCELLLINVEDLWGETEPINIPGTWKEYPNWQRRLKVKTRDWSQSLAIKNILGRVSELRATSAPRTG